MQIVSIRPLIYSAVFNKVAMSGSGDQAVVNGYHMVVTNELAPPRRMRASDPWLVQNIYLVLNDTNRPSLILREARGPADKPDELVVELKDFDNERVTLTPEKPYSRTVGYEADLKYPLTGKLYPRLRKDYPIDIEGEPYKVVDITSTKVVLSDDSNGKRFTIEQMAPP
jgi:hypothetical protein